MLTSLRSLSPLLVMISSMFVPICNYFDATETNSGKITSFIGASFPPLHSRVLLHPATWNFVTKY